MSSTHCFTSFSYSYLAKARVLARTVKRFHPEWTMWALIVDRDPVGYEFDTSEEPFDKVCYVDELEIEGFDGWMFRHEIVEACTAVKGVFLRWLLRNGADKVVYLDPDIAVFSPLGEVESLLDQHSILLTPHQLCPDVTRRAIVDNEICSLKHGTYNLGFVGVSAGGDGSRFADWWSARLIDFCRDDIPQGLFTDQRWCDLVPSFFSDHHILRDPGYNVASWNLSQRQVSFDTRGEARVNGSLLKFFHFTKLGPVGEAMTARYATHSGAVFELWQWYASEVDANGCDKVPPGYWFYGNYGDGTPVTSAARRLYGHRKDLQRAFPNPFLERGFVEWFSRNGGGE